MCGAANLQNGENESENPGVSSPLSRKNSLAFILGDEPAPTSKRKAGTAQLGRSETSPSATKRKVTPCGSQQKQKAKREPATPVAASDAEQEESRGADRTALSVNRKGSKYCIVEGCISRAKHARRCWKHGGSVKCKVGGCRNRAKTKGVCWSHGGGTICSVEQCTTIAVSNGVCWAHGGGKRCATPGCSRPAYERTGNLCAMHYGASSSSPSPASKRKQ